MKQARYIMLISEDYKSWLGDSSTFRQSQAVSSLDATPNELESELYQFSLTLDNNINKHISRNVKLVIKQELAGLNNSSSNSFTCQFCWFGP